MQEAERQRKEVDFPPEKSSAVCSVIACGIAGCGVMGKVSGGGVAL